MLLEHIPTVVGNPFLNYAVPAYEFTPISIPDHILLKVFDDLHVLHSKRAYLTPFYEATQFQCYAGLIDPSHLRCIFDAFHDLAILQSPSICARAAA